MLSKHCETCNDTLEELQKIWNLKVKIIPLVMGSLSAIPKQFGNGLKETDITAEIGQVQKAVLLVMVRISWFSKSKTAGCGLILREFPSIVLLVLAH